MVLSLQEAEVGKGIGSGGGGGEERSGIAGPEGHFGSEEMGEVGGSSQYLKVLIQRGAEVICHVS